MNTDRMTDEQAVASMKARAAELYTQGRGVQAHLLSMMAFEIEFQGANWLDRFREQGVPVPAPENIQ